MVSSKASEKGDSHPPSWAFLLAHRPCFRMNLMSQKAIHDIATSPQGYSYRARWPHRFKSKELSVLAATIERLVHDEADMLLNVH